MPSCPRCKGASFGHVFDGPDCLLRKADGVFAAVECVRCGMVAFDRRAGGAGANSSRPVADWWEGEPSLGGGVARFSRGLCARREIRFLETSRHVDGPVLALGGAGWMSDLLRKRGLTVRSIESKPHSATTVSEGGGRAGVLKRLQRARFNKGSFAVISAIHVLEHQHHPVETLQLIRNLLLDGGSLVLKVPNANCWQALLLGHRWNGCDFPRHAAMFRREDIKAILERCGYKVLRWRQFSLRDDPMGLATSLCPWLDPTIRQYRQTRESWLERVFKNALFAALVLLALPFTLLEWAGDAAASLMVEAAATEPDGDERYQGQDPGRRSTHRQTAKRNRSARGVGK